VSTETQTAFEAGDRVYVDRLGDYGKVVFRESESMTTVRLDGGSWHYLRFSQLELIVCEYCGSRKGCTCQEDIDSAEEFRRARPEDPERDFWQEYKDRRAEGDL
jgi:hypothetical protein